LLTGKYTRENPSPAGARYAESNMNPRFAARKTDEVYDVVEELTPLAQKKGVTVAQFALAWCMHQPGITSPIIGPRTMEQLEDNLGALNVEITDEDRAAVDKLVPPGRMVSPFYEADFGPHKYRW
jgi:aryl-alcohol dehydrogenase-like predicted oxidoreductase